MDNDKKTGGEAEGQRGFSPPSISLPKGGGAIRGIGEKFAANPVTGTGSMTVPIYTSPGRNGFGPQLTLSYDSGSGNGPFGFGWSLSLPSITRKTDKGLPQYRDSEESDVYILSGSEDLVPVLEEDGSQWQDDRQVDGVDYLIHRYRPRIEGLFARIERWTNLETGEIHWRTITRDNITTLYGKENNSRIFDPADPDPEQPTCIYSWLICESYDDKGNAIVYEYQEEDSENVLLSQVHEGNRTPSSRSANRYLKRIKYGNRKPNRDDEWKPTDPTQLAYWMFEVVFDYDEGHYEVLPLDPSVPADEQHRYVLASESAGHPWAIRPDPFSTYRAAFEVRTYRRCRRVLMFHNFDELGSDPYLVRSTEFEYKDLDYLQSPTVEDELAHQGSTRYASFICAVTQSGFVREDGQEVVERNGVRFYTYLKKSLPPLEFTYSKATIQEEIQEIEAESVENLPYGLDGATYRWVDLDGEGMSGILSEQAGAWFYKPNLGEGRFGPLERVAAKPSLAALSSGQQQLLDIAGDGQLDLVQFRDPTPGFYERTHEEGWESFRPFTSLPSISWEDPNLRFVDLNGDGHADVLITEHEVLTWHPSLAEEGFGPAQRVHKPLDEERGPRLVFADGTQSIYLADMSGDGLTDLVRLRNGEVCYWPSLGYGRFGAKVTMDNPPHFDIPDQFVQRRIRLADIDGSGTNDIIYLGREIVSIYFNQSGNRWSGPRRLDQFPQVNNLSTVMTADLLGNGTACLVWSSSLPGDTRRPLRYIDLMGSQKPHLLISVKNNLGAETYVQYAPSTKFYLVDKAAGKRWFTRLPFPVYVVERVDTYDRISRNRFVTRYSYHHGYFDGIEREFRGFGMVEQQDTEEHAALSTDDNFPDASNIDKASHVPPVLIRTWFHTGAYLGRERISNYFAGLFDEKDVGEYYREPGLDDSEARKRLLDDTVLPQDEDLTIEEEREACRSLKGSILRQEIYALDGSDEQEHPYTVSERNYTIKRLQPRGDNAHAVFLVHPRETIDYQYERHPEDPRVTHSLVMDVDKYGNVLKSLAIAYGRRPGASTLEDQRDRGKQELALVTYTENEFTNDFLDELDDYRTCLLWQSSTYELTGFGLESDLQRLQLSDCIDCTRPEDRFAPIRAVEEISYEASPDRSVKQKRLIERVRTLYRKNDLTGPLPSGKLESLALPFESYKMAFTSGLLSTVYRRRREGQPDENLLPVPADVLGGGDGDQGGYVDLDGNGCWWVPSGQAFYSAGGDDSAGDELSEARTHFFLPRRYCDPFGNETLADYDRPDDPTMPPYDLLVARTLDQLGNEVLFRNDYRLLQPKEMVDANDNHTEVAFDALGMVTGTSAKGKVRLVGESEETQSGDSFNGFRADLTPAEVNAFFIDPKGPLAAQLLGDATTRIIYDVTRYQRLGESEPAYAATLAREIHVSDPLPSHGLKIQTSFSYSDGFGREILKKIQAEAGPAPKRDAQGKIIVGPDGLPVMTDHDVDPRWAGNGWTIFNNKGKPVRQYEPFFSDTHCFESDVRIGVSPVLFYDPLERVVATLNTNHTWEKVVFDPWRQETWDVNDTVLQADPKADLHVGDFFRRLLEAEYLPTWHALRTEPNHAAAFAARYPDPAVREKETFAAKKTQLHAGTSTVAHFDTMGRMFLTVEHNRFEREGSVVEEHYPTHVELDIEGNQHEIIDGKGRIVIRYDYDMLGNRIHQASMESGDRLMLSDVTGKPIRAWDSRDHTFSTTYDELRRPSASYLRVGSGPKLMVGRTVYGEAFPNPEKNNLRGQVYQVFDQAGIVTSDLYDFKGKLLQSSRQLATDYRGILNWLSSVPLDVQIYTNRTTYDALNRPVTLTTPDRSIISPSYNEANLLERIDAHLRESETVTHFVNGIDYNAKGQRTLIEYGNGVETEYTYDPETFRLIHLLTKRDTTDFPDDCPDPPLHDWPGCQVQSVHYTYDPVGNITRIWDNAQQTIYFRNKRVEPSTDYTYDAIYRLIVATGREHLGQTGGQPNPPTAPDAYSHFHTRHDHPGDGRAMGTYTEEFFYDEAGNIMEMVHRGTDPLHPGWTRTYDYNEASQLESNRVNNRLSSTTIGTTTENYRYDGLAGMHGNITRMDHLADHPDPETPNMHWSFRDQLSKIDLGGGGTAYYVYDSSGQRIRKVWEKTPGLIEERIYLGGFEIFRRHNGAGAVSLERETLHIMDDKQRIALVETRTLGADPAPEQLIRYQYSNHLGSASLELDDLAQIISYEEYYPYGSTSYQAVRNQTERPKRYRYTGKERDEESGFYYHGARYYAPWLGKWTSADPAGVQDGVNLFSYVQGKPVTMRDVTGLYGLKDFNEDLARANRALSLFVPGAGLGQAVASTIEQAVKDPIILLPGGQGVKLGRDIGMTAKDLASGKIDPLTAAARLDPTGLTQKTVESAEALDRAEIAANRGDYGAAARAYFDAAISYGEIVRTGVELYLGARGVGGQKKSVSSSSAAPEPGGLKTAAHKRADGGGAGGKGGGGSSGGSGGSGKGRSSRPASENKYPVSKEEAVTMKDKTRKMEQQLDPRDLKNSRGEPRNVGYVEGQVDRKNIRGGLVSGKKSPGETIPGSENPRFETKDSGAISRQYDTEAKGLEYVAENATPQSTGSVSLYTKALPCSSCAGVIDQFRLSFLGIELQVVTGKDAMMRINLLGNR
jgi:RHS repeat-associated protein